MGRNVLEGGVSISEVTEDDRRCGSTTEDGGRRQEWRKLSEDDGRWWFDVLQSRFWRAGGVRATAVGRDAVLAGDPKVFRLLCNTNLITNVPSRGSEEERIRIHLQVRPNIRNNGYKR